MFPLGSVSRSITGFPFVTALIILINAGVFYLELERGDAFVLRWSAVPAEISTGRDLETLITSAFLHGGWLHIIGNMVFLWAFGPQMEEAMNSLRFLVFYLLGAVAAMGAQVWGDPTGTIPALGASGAVAAVMGAFLVTYPRDTIRTLILIPPIIRVVYIPAVILIGLWIALQFASYSTELEQGRADAGGVAYLAHIGGAIFGAVTGRLFLR
jgi:membrane associated rhomboid family serine protease